MLHSIQLSSRPQRPAFRCSRRLVTMAPRPALVTSPMEIATRYQGLVLPDGVKHNITYRSEAPTTKTFTTLLKAGRRRALTGIRPTVQPSVRRSRISRRFRGTTRAPAIWCTTWMASAPRREPLVFATAGRELVSLARVVAAGDPARVRQVPETPTSCLTKTQPARVMRSPHGKVAFLEIR